MMTPEGKVKAMVKKYLGKWSDRGMNIYCFTPATGGYGVSGVPDFVCCINGKFVAFECKAGDNKLTALQQRACERIEEANGFCFIIYCEADMELAYLALVKRNL